jgi:hypothetical protein
LVRGGGWGTIVKTEGGMVLSGREVHRCDGEESASQHSGSGIGASKRTRARKCAERDCRGW